jgi:hypothetical protein
MMRILRTDEPREEELAALADGSLSPQRRAVVEAMVERSPELAARLAEQRDAVALLRDAAAAVDAPAGLRARLEPQPRLGRRYVWAAGLAAAAVVVVALVLALPESVPGGPTVAEAAVVATRPATAAPPAASNRTLLARSVEGVPFPNWQGKFAWQATGVRVDTMEGRRLTTVFYEKNGRRIGYTIVAGDALGEPGRARVVHRGGTALQLLTVGGRPTVTWLRRDHTCILSGAGVDAATLAKLAAWTGRGTVPF